MTNVLDRWSMKLEEWSALKNGAKIECTYVMVFVDIMDTQLCEHNNSRKTWPSMSILYHKCICLKSWTSQNFSDLDLKVKFSENPGNLIIQEESHLGLSNWFLTYLQLKTS